MVVLAGSLRSEQSSNDTVFEEFGSPASPMSAPDTLDILGSKDWAIQRQDAQQGSHPE